MAISESEFASAKHAFQNLDRLLLLEERFDLLATNFLDFESLLVTRLLHNKHLGFVDGNHQMLIRRDANRVLMNVLTSARAYIDQLPSIASDLFGEEDHRTSKCAELLRDAYDNRLGYRVFEALRNHTQHAGFAVHTISYGTHMHGDYPNLLATKSFRVLTDPEILATNQKLKPRILQELVAMGKQVDLRPLLCEYVAGIARAHYFAREEVGPVFEVAAKKLSRLYSNYTAAYPDTQPPLGIYAVKFDGEHWADRVPLATGNDEYLVHLRSINMHLAHADSTFLIGSVAKEA